MTTIERHMRPTFITYLLTLVAFYFASFATDIRLWGVNWWGFLPAWAAVSLLVIGILGGTIVYTRRLSVSLQTDLSSRSYGAIAVALVILLGAAFTVFKIQTHFLGDGYQLLSELGQAQPVIKPSNIGGVYPQYWLGNKTGLLSVLSAYRLIAVLSGILFTLVTVITMRHWYDSRRLALFGSLLVLTGGYMLQFFGYVENYALFLVVVLVFTVIGGLIADGRIGRWWLLPILAISIFVHVFGVFLVPPAIYLMLRQTSAGRKLQQASRNTKILLTVITAIVLGAGYVYLRSQSLFFELAFLRLTSGRFTVNGYTLFSFTHIVDFLNLMVVLVPGLVVLIAAINIRRFRDLWRKNVRIRFLSVLTFTSLAGVFIVDPKLGMPRDWDLMAFCGIPMMLFLLDLLMHAARHRALVPAYTILTVTLNLLLLGPRVATTIMPNSSVDMMAAYIYLDPIKSRPGFTPLQNYLVDNRMVERAVEMRGLHDRLYPEMKLEKQADRLLMQGDIRGARLLIRRVLARNPIMWTTYNMLGRSYLSTNQLDSALTYFQVSDALNPYNPFVIANLGLTYEMMHRPDMAREKYISALKHDSMTVDANFGMMRLSLADGDIAEANRYLDRMNRIDALSSEYFQRAAETALGHNAAGVARKALQYGLERGLDTAVVKRMQQKDSNLVRPSVTRDK